MVLPSVGARAALLGTALAAFEPNLVANASLITFDTGSTLFVVLAVYLLWEYTRGRSWWILAGAGLSTGLALASKATGVLLLPIGAGLLAAQVVLPSALTGPAALGNRLKQALVVFAVVGTVAPLVVLATYFFQGWGTWIGGVLAQASLAETHWPAYFLGNYSQDGWYAYYPVAFLIKTPIASIGLIAVSFVLCRLGVPLRLCDALFLLLPSAVWLAVLIPGRVDVGVRYLLPIYPFLFVCAARLATVTFARPGMAALVLAGAVGLSAISSLRTMPHPLAYFNELIGGPEQGHRYLLDSNLDWGQDLVGLREYSERERLPPIYLSYFGTASPEAYGIHFQEAPNFDPVSWPPGPGESVADQGPQLLAISANNLYGLYLGEPGPYAPFARRQPRAKIGYSIWVFDITNDADAHNDLGRVYLDAAAREEKRAAKAELGGNAEAAARRREGATRWRMRAQEEWRRALAISGGQGPAAEVARTLLDAHGGED